MTGSPLSPAELARIALRRIAELRIAPTPEHFARHYHEALNGVPPPVPPTAAAVSPELVRRIHDLVTQASATSAELVSGLAWRNDELGVSLDGLVDAVVSVDAKSLLQDVVDTARDIHATVKASHAELMDTRRSLAEIKAELEESRKQLGQDPLTGTENRRSMGMILDREIARARRDNEPLCVAMIDIDHFKKVNDTHGHATGDAALVHLTQTAKAMLRGNDAFIRYGGEEFVLVLPETALQGGVFAAERLKLLLQKRPLHHQGKVITMSFSAGVTVLKAEDNEASLLERADACMYRAKQAGRNCVVAGE